MRILALILAVASWIAIGTSSAFAACGEVNGDLGEISQVCEYNDSEINQLRSDSPASVWEFLQLCMEGTSGGSEVCANPRVCELRGSVGTWYVVRRDGATIGRACLTHSEAAAQRGDVAALAIRAFRQLSWPSSELGVQPRGNETLVNLETIFFTSNDAPSTRSVTLLGREVEIEATPTYTWVFGDGETETTSSPGHAYPDHDVSHVYASAGPVRARVDTTYRGRFRVGDGPWQDIAETLTVAGEPVDLEVREARPVLVR